MVKNKKPKVRRTHYTHASPWNVTVSAADTAIEFWESETKRAVITLEDWQINMLVRKLSAVPIRRAQDAKLMKNNFMHAITETNKVNET